jgi:hypothetical protein
MNNYNITFEDLRKITDYLNKGYDDLFVDYLNSFRGDDIYEKFKNILKCWENDVNSSIEFNFEDRPVKIQLSYIISQLSEMVEMSESVKIFDEGIELHIGIPDVFQNIELIPIYNTVKYINISGIFINLTNLSLYEKTQAINSLPPKIYNIIYKNIINIKTKKFEIDNPILKDFRLNMLSNEVYFFLKGLFSKFDEYYFNDVIFHLSKRIDGSLLLKSTPIEIGYYIDRYSKELESQNNNLNI